MQQWMNLMEVNCDPAREEEFRAWFREVHMADVLTTPGFVGARQHETKEFRDGRGKYLNVYYLETDDIDRTMKHAFGVMADDLVAAGYTLVVLSVAMRIIGSSM